MGAYTYVRGTINDTTKEEVLNNLSFIMGGIVTEYSNLLQFNGMSLPLTVDEIKGEDGNTSVYVWTSHKFEDFEHSKISESLDSIIPRLCEKMGNADFSVSPYQLDASPEIAEEYEKEHPDYFEQYHKIYPPKERETIKSYDMSDLPNGVNIMPSYRYLQYISETMDKDGTLSMDDCLKMGEAEKKANKYVELLMSDNFDNKRTYYNICLANLVLGCNPKEATVEDFNELSSVFYTRKTMFGIKVADMSDNEMKGLAWFFGKEGNKDLCEYLKTALIDKIDKKLLEEKILNHNLFKNGEYTTHDSKEGNTCRWSKTFGMNYNYGFSKGYKADTYNYFSLMFERNGKELSLNKEGQQSLDEQIKKIVDLGEVEVLCKLCGQYSVIDGYGEKVEEYNRRIEKAIIDEGDFDKAENILNGDLTDKLKECISFRKSKFDNGLEDLIGKKYFDGQKIFDANIDVCLDNFIYNCKQLYLPDRLGEVCIPLSVPYEDKDKFKEECMTSKVSVPYKWLNDRRCWGVSVSALSNKDIYDLLDNNGWITNQTNRIYEAYQDYLDDKDREYNSRHLTEDDYERD